MEQASNFLGQLIDYYTTRARDLPWRRPEADGSFDPYKILVSEIMLQQTQVTRVVPKYYSFLQKFPTIFDLANAPLADVLTEWVGLGYNRRAKFLWQAARGLSQKPEPWLYEDLVSQPGIGPNTAAAILAYSYNLPVLFVETNIRTVMIHHFFHGRHDISDKEIAEVLEAVVPWNNKNELEPREFYWAVMDYGTHLKATIGNLNRYSKSYNKQSAFAGSKRKVRGQIIRLLATGPKTLDELRSEISDERLDDIIGSLISEELVKLQDNTLMLYNDSEETIGFKNNVNQ